MRGHSCPNYYGASSAPPYPARGFRATTGAGRGWWTGKRLPPGLNFRAPGDLLPSPQGRVLGGSMEARHWGQLLGEAKASLDDTHTSVATGFNSIDNVLRGGFRSGHLCLLLGRTGVGKTAVATQIAVNAAASGQVVGYVSLEMGSSEIVVRALSAHLGASIDVTEYIIRKGEDERLVDLKTLSVHDPTKPTWEELGDWYASLESLYGAKPSLVVIDHLSLMRRYGSKNEVERVTMLAEDAKIFAREQGVALLVLHQVGRNDGDRKNHGHLPLSMESARYGGEADADVVLGVYRPSLDPELGPYERSLMEKDVVFQVLKNRHGQQDVEGVKLQWHKPSFTFTEGAGKPTYL